MSMNYYGINDYGLVLNEQDMKYLVMDYCEDYDDEEFKKDPYGYYDVIVDHFDLIYNSNFNGDVVPIDDDGTDGWHNYDNLCDDVIFYVPFNKYPKLFKAVYENIDDIIAEMKKKIGKYLPADFDYRNKLRHIIGTTFG